MKEQTFRFRCDSAFVAVNYNTLMCGQLDVYEIAVYCILCAFAGGGGKTCYPSYQTIARKANISRRKAVDVIASLERRGLLEKEAQATGAGKGTSNLYLIKTLSNAETTVENKCKSDADGGETPEVVRDMHPPRADAAPPMVQQAHQPSASPAPKIERTNKPHLKNPHSSIAPEREDTDMDLLKTEIEYGYFEEQMPDKLPFIDTLLGVMLALRQENAPENRRLLAEMDSCVVLEFLDEMRGRKLTDVHSYAAWLKQVFMDFLRKRDAELAALK